MSWHYLQEQEAASWEVSSLVGAPSALLKLIPTASASCSPDSETESCRAFRFGTTCEHRRERIWILASNPNVSGLARRIGRTARGLFALDDVATSRVFPQHKDNLPAPQLLGSGHGMADFVDRTRAVGNGQVPQCMALAFETLAGNFSIGE